jgi:hypothetical protein
MTLQRQPDLRRATHMDGARVSVTSKLIYVQRRWLRIVQPLRQGNLLGVRVMSKRIVGLVVLIWSLLIIAWASLLVYDLSSPYSPIMAKRDPQPHSGHTKPFRRG